MPATSPLGPCTRYLVLTVEGGALGPFLSVYQASNAHKAAYPKHSNTCGCEMGRFDSMFKREGAPS